MSRSGPGRGRGGKVRGGSAVLPPRAWQRLVRDRGSLAVALLLAAYAASVATVTHEAQIRLVDTVDENWRGLYDLLVRPAGARTALEVEHNLVEPNFLGFSGDGGIERRQLETIRRLPGVELAAPIAMVGYLPMEATSPFVHLSWEALPTAPNLYRFDARFWTFDGVLEHDLAEMSEHAVLPPPSDGSPWHTFPGHGGDPDDGGWLLLDFPPLPALPSPLIAIDPEAERELLGPSAAFLAPLTALEPDMGRTTGGFDTELIPAAHDDAARRISLLRHVDETDIPVVPLLLSEHVYAPVEADLRIHAVGEPLEDPSSAGAGSVIEEALQQRESDDLDLVARKTLDLSDTIRPFHITSAVFSWPDGLPLDGEVVGGMLQQDFTAQLAGPLTYAATGPRSPDQDRVSLRVMPAQSPGGYRPLSVVDLETAPLETVTSSRDLPFVLAPVGDFDLAELELPDNPIQWAPPGAYEVPQSELVAHPDGSAAASRMLMPTFDPAGLLQPPPLAITDLDGAQLLRGPDSIDAIRVRVAGIERFDADAQGRVAEVAASIAGLGLEVDIMAGASPQHVELFVPSYTADGEDLGWIRQPWSTLGAAHDTVTALSETNRALLAVSAATAALLTVGLQLLRAVARRGQARTLAVIGWSRPGILWWLAGDGVLAGALVLIAAVAVGAVAGLRANLFVLAGSFGFALAVAAMVASMVAIRGIGSRPMGPVPRAARLLRAVDPSQGPARYALRRLLTTPARTVVTTMALTVGAVGVAVLTSLVLALPSRVGPTLLAAFTTGELRLHQITIVVVTALGGMGLFLTLWSSDVRSRRFEIRILALLGVRSADVHATARWQLGIMGAAGTVVAVEAGRRVASHLTAVSGRAAVIAAAVTALGMLVVAARASRLDRGR